MAWAPKRYHREVKKKGIKSAIENENCVLGHLWEPSTSMFDLSISSGDEFLHSDSPWWNDEDEVEDVEGSSSKQLGEQCSETNTQTLASASMEDCYIPSSGIQEHSFVGLGNYNPNCDLMSLHPTTPPLLEPDRLPTMGSKRSLQRQKLIENSLQRKSDIISSTSASPSKPEGEDSRVTSERKRGIFRNGPERRAKAMGRDKACASCRSNHIMVISTPFWLMNSVTYTLLTFSATIRMSILPRLTT